MPLITRRWLGYLLLIITVVALRWNSFDRAIWNIDEGSTFTMAQQVLAGDVLYRDAADNRGPLVPFAKAAMLLIAGDWNFSGVHMGVAIMLGLTACLLVGIGRNLGNEKAGWAAGVTFALLNVSFVGIIDTMAAHTEWFLVFFSALGFYAFTRSWAQPKTVWALLAGLCFGAGFMAKQPGLLDFGVTWVISLLGIILLPAHRRQIFRNLLVMLAGGALLFGLVIAYFAAHGAIRDFIFYVWTYNTQFYMPEIPSEARWTAALTPFQLGWQYAPVALVFGLITAGGLLLIALRGLFGKPAEIRVLAWLVLGWAAAGIVATGLSGRNFDHYTQQALPGLALAVGWGAAWLWQALGSHRVFRWIGAGALAGLFFSLLIPSLHRTQKIASDDSIYPTLGKIVQAATAPADRIFVWGYAPDLYAASHRLPASRYLYTNYVTGMVPWTNLDPEIDTAYASVPGSAALMLGDLQRQPPALIIDTRKDRGYLKYPLQEQTALWEYIEANYVEIARDQTIPLDYHFYKRAAQLPSATVPPALSENPEIILTAPTITPLRTLSLFVKAPVGSSDLTLLLDGKPYRRVSGNPDQATDVSFFVTASDLTPGKHHLQIQAAGSSPSLSPPLTVTIDPSYSDAPPPSGPPIEFDGLSLQPIASKTHNGLPVIRDKDGHWNAHAPAILTYLRPAELDRITFTFGMQPGSYSDDNKHGTQGVRVVVDFINDADGKQQEIFRRLLNPMDDKRDRGDQIATIRLPLNQKGRLVFRFILNRLNDPAFCWTYLRTLTGERTQMFLTMDDKRVYPDRIDSPMGLNPFLVDGEEVIMAHAPSQLDYPFLPGMKHLYGRYGLLDTAWNGDKKNNSTIFEVRQIKADGSIRILFSRTLDAAGRPADRGPQRLSLQLPDQASGRLQLITKPAHPPDNAFAYSYWHRLAAGQIEIAIPTDSGREVHTLKQESMFGLSYADEDNEKVLFAHASSALTFPIDPSLTTLEGSIAMMRGSYTAGKATEGVIFIIESVNAGGTKTELFRRMLRPFGLPEDRGSHSFSVALPDLPGGQLILRTEPAVEGHHAYTWSIWSHLRFKTKP